MGPRVAVWACLTPYLILITCALVIGGCVSNGRFSAPIVATAGDGIVAVRVRAEVLVGRDGPCVRCEVAVKNVSQRFLVVFNDRQLPTVLCLPGGTADVFYGLTKDPGYQERFTSEELGWQHLLPEEEIVHVFILWNPLGEHAYYGNPWIDNPQSEHFIPFAKQVPDSEQYDPVIMRRHCLWHELQVRVGYLDISDCRTAFDVDLSPPLGEGMKVTLGTKQVGILDLQKEVEVHIKPKN